MLAGMLLSCSLDLSAQEQASAHNILILSFWDPGNLYVQQVTPGLQSELEETILDFQLYQEHLDARRFTSDSTREIFATYLAQKYQDIQIDAVVTISAPAVHFFDQHSPIFEQEVAPVNIAAGSNYIGELTREENESSSHKIFVDHINSLKQIQAIYPIDQLLIIGDIIDIDGTERFNSFQHQIESSDFNFNLDYLIDQPLTDLLNQVSQLPPRTAIYYMGSFKDVNGKFTAPEEVIEVISARGPTHRFFPTGISPGKI